MTGHIAAQQLPNSLHDFLQSTACAQQIDRCTAPALVTAQARGHACEMPASWASQWAAAARRSLSAAAACSCLASSVARRCASRARSASFACRDGLTDQYMMRTALVVLSCWARQTECRCACLCSQCMRSTEAPLGTPAAGLWHRRLKARRPQGCCSAGGARGRRRRTASQSTFVPRSSVTRFASLAKSSAACFASAASASAASNCKAPPGRERGGRGHAHACTGAVRVHRVHAKELQTTVLRRACKSGAKQRGGSSCIHGLLQPTAEL